MNTYRPPSNLHNTIHDETSRVIDDSFQGRLYMTIEETAGILNLDVKTLRQLCEAGRIGFVVVGAGIRRPRRRFTREHVAGFLANRRRGAGDDGSGAPRRLALRESLRTRKKGLE